METVQSNGSQGLMDPLFWHFFVEKNGGRGGAIGKCMKPSCVTEGCYLPLCGMVSRLEGRGDLMRVASKPFPVASIVVLRTRC